MCIPYLFIDASPKDYPEEENIYEEEEHFDQYTNQGKLIPMQAIVRECKMHLHFIYLGNLTNPKFLPCKLLSKYFYSSPLSEYSFTTSLSRF